MRNKWVRNRSSTTLCSAKNQCITLSLKCTWHSLVNKIMILYCKCTALSNVPTNTFFPLLFIFVFDEFVTVSAFDKGLSIHPKDQMNIVYSCDKAQWFVRQASSIWNGYLASSLLSSMFEMPVYHSAGLDHFGHTNLNHNLWKCVSSPFLNLYYRLWVEFEGCRRVMSYSALFWCIFAGVSA